jgi:hypothetical protein
VSAKTDARIYCPDKRQAYWDSLTRKNCFVEFNVLGPESVSIDCFSVFSDSLYHFVVVVHGLIVQLEKAVSEPLILLGPGFVAVDGTRQLTTQLFVHFPSGSQFFTGPIQVVANVHEIRNEEGAQD